MREKVVQSQMREAISSTRYLFSYRDGIPPSRKLNGVRLDKTEVRVPLGPMLARNSGEPERQRFQTETHELLIALGVSPLRRGVLYGSASLAYSSEESLSSGLPVRYARARWFASGSIDPPLLRSSHGYGKR